MHARLPQIFYPLDLNLITLPINLSWTILVLLLKGNVDTRGISLIEVPWKLVEAIINTWAKIAVKFHDILHGFYSNRGTRTATMELNMYQDMATINCEPLFLVLLYLGKAYNTLERRHLLQTLEGYGTGPKLRGILENFWENQEVVTRQSG